MGAAALVVGLIILGLVLGTYLLQVMVWLAALAVQLIVWAFWGVAGAVSLVWLAIADRRELARIWRETRTRRLRRVQSFG